MAVRMTKPWLSVAEAQGLLRGNLGVFQLADEQEVVQFIGYAGGHSLFGLKGEVAAALEKVANVSRVRFEVSTAYHTRYRELLMAHQADFGALPPANPPVTFTLGKMSPA